MLKKKDGDFLVKNLLSLIIGAAILLFLIILFFRIFSAGYDPIKETSQGYFDQLKIAVNSAEKSGMSDYSPLALPSSEVKYLLVYFGDKNMINDFLYSSGYSHITQIGYETFVVEKDYYTNLFLKRPAKNSLCVCHVFISDNSRYSGAGRETAGNVLLERYSVDSFCSLCFNLDYPAEFNRRINKEAVYDLEKNSFIIRKSNNQLLFEVIER